MSSRHVIFTAIQIRKGPVGFPGLAVNTCFNWSMLVITDQNETIGRLKVIR